MGTLWLDHYLWLQGVINWSLDVHLLGFCDLGNSWRGWLRWLLVGLLVFAEAAWDVRAMMLMAVWRRFYLVIRLLDHIDLQVIVCSVYTLAHYFVSSVLLLRWHCRMRVGSNLDRGSCWSSFTTILLTLFADYVHSLIACRLALHHLPAAHVLRCRLGLLQDKMVQCLLLVVLYHAVLLLFVISCSRSPFTKSNLMLLITFWFWCYQVFFAAVWWFAVVKSLLRIINILYNIFGLRCWLVLWIAVFRIRHKQELVCVW